MSDGPSLSRILEDYEVSAAIVGALGIPADEPCTPEDCDSACRLEGDEFVRDAVVVNGWGADCDVEAYCQCEHHGLPPR